MILKDWGRLEEALTLLRKKETICLQLGSKSGLGYCYAQWGQLERQMGNAEAANEKLSKALAVFQDLKMPRERDAVLAELNPPQTAAAT